MQHQSTEEIKFRYEHKSRTYVICFILSRSQLPLKFEITRIIATYADWLILF